MEAKVVEPREKVRPAVGRLQFRWALGQERVYRGPISSHMMLGHAKRAEVVRHLVRRASRLGQRTVHLLRKQDFLRVGRDLPPVVAIKQETFGHTCKSNTRQRTADGCLLSTRN